MGRIAVVQTTSSKESGKRLSKAFAAVPSPCSGQGPCGREIVDETVEVTNIGAGFEATVSMGRRRAPVQRSALPGVEHRRPRLRDRSPPTGPMRGRRGSFPAKLAKLLLARHRAGAGPITLFPCELTLATGNALRAAALGVLDRWQAQTRRRAAGSRPSASWPNSLARLHRPPEPLKPVCALQPYALWAIE